MAQLAPDYAGRSNSTQLSELRAEIGRTLYTDCRQPAVWLATTHGVPDSVSGLTDFLHQEDFCYQGGFCYTLTTSVPCQAHSAVQTAFVTDTLAPLLAAAEAGEARGCFADAAHPTHNTRPSYVRTKMGQKRPLLTVRDRERVNLKAALNALAPTQVHLDKPPASLPRPRSGSTRSCWPLPQGARSASAATTRYYQNKDLSAWLTRTRLAQVFLPLYSSNLNLIERLWKLLRQKIIDSHFTDPRARSRPLFFTFFTRLDELRPALVSLMRLRFHTYGAAKHYVISMTSILR